MSKVDITGTADGAVHVVSPIGGSEHTLCGIAVDAAASENMPSLEWVHPKGEIVTCRECASVIRLCRRVKVARELS